MSKPWLTLIILVLCGLPTVATAQLLGNNVIISRSVLTLQEQRINIDDLVDDEANPAPIRLSWSVSGLGFGDFEYELTYGAITQTSSTPPRLRVIESDGFAEAQGDQIAGELRVELFLRDIIADSEDLPIALGGEGRDEYDEAICVNVYPAGNPDPDETTSDCWTFDVDTLAPPAPIITELIPGEGRVLVLWERLNDNDIDAYEVVYCTNVSTAAESFTELPCPVNERGSSGEIGSTENSASISRGINTGERVALAMRSIDEFVNVGDPGDVSTAVPVPVDDFFELYEGNEDGGFCFMATAAHGSYAHPTVRILRAFRDRILTAVPFGPAAIAVYYKYSPPLAARLSAAPHVAAPVRIGLVILAAFAALMMLCPLVALGWLIAMVARGLFERSGRVSRGWTAGGAAVLALLVAVPAEAKRPESELETLGIGIEFKGGPYSGAIQDETGFSDVFGSGGQPLFVFGLDLQLYRGFGTVTAGGTVGFLRYSGFGLFGEGSGMEGDVSSDENELSIVPMTAVVGYRFDWLADNTWFPFVPYAEGGLAYYVWWATNGVGNLQRRTVDGERQEARGGTLGYTGTLGLAFMLNKLDTKAAKTLFSNTGIRGTYVFFEVTSSQVDDFGGDGFDLSDFNWSVGLYMEL